MNDTNTDTVMSICQAADCNKEATRLRAGFCEYHYREHQEAQKQNIPCWIEGCDGYSKRCSPGPCRKHYLQYRDAPQCSVADCTNKVSANGWCQTHYMRWYRHGNVYETEPIHGTRHRHQGCNCPKGKCIHVAPAPKRPPRICNVDSCDRVVCARNLCDPHYRRWRTHGDTLAHIPIGRPKKKPCQIPECERLAESHGYCQPHGYRLQTYGDPRFERYPEGGRRIDVNGYVHVRINGVLRREHRWIMEQWLQRPLRPGETVHHLNGIRTDNRIENLELWSKHQPPGQRVVDVLDWCRQFIIRYETEEALLRKESN